MKISDEAVEAAAERFRADGHSTLGCGLYDLEKTTQDALEAAVPYLMPDREALEQALEAELRRQGASEFYDVHRFTRALADVTLALFDSSEVPSDQPS